MNEKKVQKIVISGHFHSHLFRFCLMSSHFVAESVYEPRRKREYEEEQQPRKELNYTF